MQSLDVGIFQSYKKWHDTAIKEAVAESFVEYLLTRFLSDLIKIRNNIFKSIIIRHVFEKCGMWSVNSDACIKLLKKFNYSVKVKELTLSLLRQENQLDEVAEMEQALRTHWDLKIARNTQWSDSTDETQFSVFMNNSARVIFNTLMNKTELRLYQQRRMTELHGKKYARKRLRAESGNLGLTKEDAERVIVAKLQKEKEVEKKRVDAQFMKFWRMKKDDVHVKGVAARKAEKARIKQMKEMTKSHTFISVELLQPILDLEAEWKATNPTWLTQEEVKKFKRKKSRVEGDDDDDDDEEMKIIVNPSKQSWENDDFVSFEDDEDENAGHAANAEYAEHENYDPAEHDIDAEFLPGDFFDRMYDE